MLFWGWCLPSRPSPTVVMRRERDSKTVSLVPLGALGKPAFTPLESSTQLASPLCQGVPCATAAPERTAGSLGTDHRLIGSSQRGFGAEGQC